MYVVFINLKLCIYTYVQSNFYVYGIDAYMHACMHTHTHTHARTHARTHTHTSGLQYMDFAVSRYLYFLLLI